MRVFEFVPNRTETNDKDLYYRNLPVKVNVQEVVRGDDALLVLLHDMGAIHIRIKIFEVLMCKY